jgi:hypothetical protein
MRRWRCGGRLSSNVMELLLDAIRRGSPRSFWARLQGFLCIRAVEVGLATTTQRGVSSERPRDVMSHPTYGKQGWVPLHLIFRNEQTSQALGLPILAQRHAPAPGHSVTRQMWHPLSSIREG